MTHALVVGGTGMLRPVSLYLAAKYNKVSVVAMSDRLDSLVSESDKINPIRVDYCNTAVLDSALQAATNEFGRFDIAVIWVHLKKAPEAPYVIAKYVSGRYIHLLPSWTADPAKENQKLQKERHKRFEEIKNLNYQEIILGWQGSRWLHNDEISAGTIYAIEHPKQKQVIGTVEPWSAKPL